MAHNARRDVAVWVAARCVIEHRSYFDFAAGDELAELVSQVPTLPKRSRRVSWEAV